MKILCAVDGSEYSQWAIEAIGSLGHRPLTSLTLLHVIDPHHLKQIGSPHMTGYRGAKAALTKAGEALLKRMRHQAEVAISQSAVKPRTTVRTLLLEGAAASTIVQRAAQERSDLIVLGTRGLSDIKGFLLGSTSRKVAALAPCPVLVIKRQPGTMNRVLLAVDDSKHSRRAARYLRSGILPDSATITVLSAVQSPLTDLAARYMPEKEQQALMRPALERAEQLVAGMREELLKEGYAVVTDVQSNHVTDSIIKQAEADRTDLLVIGSRALTKSERLYLGSVSESLLKYAPCSVLIVRGAGTA